MLLSCFSTRRTARARSLDHRRVTRPRLRITEAEMQGFSTGYLRVLPILSNTIASCAKLVVSCDEAIILRGLWLFYILFVPSTVRPCLAGRPDFCFGAAGGCLAI